MEVITAGQKQEENVGLNPAGCCTEEPGDNCWLQLD